MKGLCTKGIKRLVPSVFAVLLFACSGGESGSNVNGKGEKLEGAGQDGKGGRMSKNEGSRRQGAGQQRPGRGQSVDIDVSDKELKSFVKLSKKVIPIQKEMQKEQQKSIEESSLTRKRYRQIMMAMQQKKNANMTDKERSEVQKLQKEQQEQMKEMRNKIQKKVEESDAMSWDRFNEIAQALNQDQELKQRFQKLRQEQGIGGNAGSGGASAR